MKSVNDTNGEKFRIYKSMSFYFYRALEPILIDAAHVFTRTCKITNEDVRTNVLQAYRGVLDAGK